MRARIRLAFGEGGFGMMVGMTTAIGTATILFIGVRHVQTGVLTLGDLLLIMSYVVQLYEPLKTIGRQSATLQRSLASAERAFALLDEAPDVVDDLPNGSGRFVWWSAVMPVDFRKYSSNVPSKQSKTTKWDLSRYCSPFRVPRPIICSNRIRDLSDRCGVRLACRSL